MKGIIFDLDGTLLDTSLDLNKAINLALNEYGFSALSVKETIANLGYGFKFLATNSLPKDKQEEYGDKVLESFKRNYSECYKEKTCPYEGIKELLLKLNDNYLLAVNSNKQDDYTKNLVSTIFPEINFVSVYGMREGIPGKPDPYTVEEILKEMNLEKEEVLYIGDSKADLDTANNASLKFLAVTWGFRSEQQLKEAGAKNFARKAEDIYSFLSYN